MLTRSLRRACLSRNRPDRWWQHQATLQTHKHSVSFDTPNLAYRHQNQNWSSLRFRLDQNEVQNHKRTCPASWAFVCSSSSSIFFCCNSSSCFCLASSCCRISCSWVSPAGAVWGTARGRGGGAGVTGAGLAGTGCVWGFSSGCKQEKEDQMLLNQEANGSK